MKVHFLTIVLDGQPWVTMHYPVFRRLPFDWHWHVVEGVAENINCTSWCKKIEPRLSNDGTTQYLDSLKFDSRISIYRNLSWKGKLAMVNEPLKHVTDRECLLWQIDADEVWREDQITKMRRIFMSDRSHTSAQFFCRYFVGPNLITEPRGMFGNRNYDWVRVWRFSPGMKFKTHEPPVLSGEKGFRFTQQETAAEGLVFDHYAYALESTVAFKQQYYNGKHDNYRNAVESWRALQEVKTFPVRLRKYFRWVDDNVQVRRLHE